MLEVESKINVGNLTPLNTKLHSDLKDIFSVIKSLEINYIAAQKNDRLLLMALRMESIRNISLESQLQQAVNENKQILEMVQLRDGDADMSRVSSKLNLGTFFVYQS